VYVVSLCYTNYGLFAPKTIRSRERKFQVWNFRTLELLLLGTFAPTNKCSKERYVVPPICIGLRVRNCHCHGKKLQESCFFIMLYDIQWSNYGGARGGLAHLKDLAAPAKHLS